MNNLLSCNIELKRVLAKLVCKVPKNDKQKMLCFKNKFGKEWLIEAYSRKALSKGLCLYDPISFKGKIVKRLLPLFYRFLCFLFPSKFRVLYLEITPFLSELIQKSFKLQDGFHCNFFFGTPGTNQKIVVQIDDGKRIFGYIKAASNNETIRVFRDEFNRLNSLNQNGVNNIPQALLLTEEDKAGFFVQTSSKSFNYSQNDRLMTQAIDFIKMLNQKTERTILFQDSFFWKSISSIGFGDIKDSFIRDSYLRSISYIENKFWNSFVIFSVSHGDFTPWNTYFTNNAFYSFDFEYSRETMPKYIDLFHWITSVYIFHNKNDANKLVKQLLCLNIGLSKDNLHDLAIMYFTYEICFYLSRDKEMICKIDYEHIRFYSKALVLLLKLGTI